MTEPGPNLMSLDEAMRVIRAEYGAALDVLGSVRVPGEFEETVRRQTRQRAALDAYSEVMAGPRKRGNFPTQGDHERAIAAALDAADKVDQAARLRAALTRPTDTTYTPLAVRALDTACVRLMVAGRSHVAFGRAVSILRDELAERGYELMLVPVVDEPDQLG